MPQPRQVTATAEELIRVYIDAWQTIVAEQERILSDPRRGVRRRRLNELRVAVERELDRLDVPTRGWLRTRLPQVYAAGAESTLTVLGGEAITWTGLHTSAVQRLATDTFTDLLRATEFVREDTKRFIREAAKAASERALTTGRTAQGAARTLSGAMRDRGIAAVIYRDGSRHGLAEYAETVLRTKTAVAYNEGTVNTAVERGMTTFEIFDGVGCGLTGHRSGPSANGMIVDAETAAAWPLSHPRCRRAFAARPDLAPARGRPTASTFAQDATETIQAPRTTRTPRTPRAARQPRQRRRQRA
jgi:hypothetical protein